MARPKHLVKLSVDERERLTALIRTGTASAHVQRHARILLKADCSDGSPACDDATIAAAVEVSRPTVERVRRTFTIAGLDAALQRKSWTGPSRRKLDGAQEAQLARLACSPPPKGAERWTLTLLADKLVELKVVDSIARDTVRLTLKKTRSSRG
jgi:homeodomain-containing protein